MVELELILSVCFFIGYKIRPQQQQPLLYLGFIVYRTDDH
jgi:hypothetical protein